MEDEGKPVKSRADQSNWRHFLTGGESIALLLFPSERQAVAFAFHPILFCVRPLPRCKYKGRHVQPTQALLSAGKMVPS